VAGSATAPGIVRGLAAAGQREDVADGGPKDAVIREAQGREERQLAEEDGVRQGAGGRGLAVGDVAGQHRIRHQIDGGDGHVGLVVGIGPPPVLAHDHPVRQVAGLKAHDVGGPQAQPAAGIGAGPHDVIAASADDQEGGARGVGIDVDQVVGKQAAQAGRGVGGLNLGFDVVVQIHMQRRLLDQAGGINDVDEGLHIRGKLDLGLWSCTDVGQKQVVAANHCRQQLVREGALRGLCNGRTPWRGSRIGAEDGAVEQGRIRARLRAESGAVGRKADIRQGGQGDAGDGAGVGHRKRLDDASFPGIKALAGSAGDELGEELGDEHALVLIVGIAVVGDRHRHGMPPTGTVPMTERASGSMMETVLAV
jgi:hypothetical protein